MRLHRCSSVIALLLQLGWPALAQAKLGNLPYEEGELGVAIASFDEETFTGPPGGSNTALMLRDYMIVMSSHDSGVPDGPLHVFDVSDPRQPELVTRFTAAETEDLRELHAMPVAMLDGRDILVFPTTSGVRFFDFTDPAQPEPIGELELDGVNGGDYDNAAWMTSWAWPYVYVGGTGNGVYVVDARDPTQPSLVTRIETGELGGFRVGPVYAAGNYVIASGMDATPTRVSVLDAGDPGSPFLLATGAAPASMYSALVIGDRIYGSGEGGRYSLLKWSAEAVEALGDERVFGSDKGGYCTYQDAFIFCGQSSEGYRKIDVSDEENLEEVAQADIDAGDADTDFATVLGNLVYVGNDHGSGAALFPHQTAPDGNPPELLMAYPENGALQQPLASRVTLFFSDEIDLDSVTSENIIVRPVGGQAVAGVFSHSSFNAISFGAKEPLLPDTTYEVVVVQNGLTDLAQNPIAEETVTRFSTGDTIELPAGSGGAAGAGAIGGSGGGAAGTTNAGTGAASPGGGTGGAAGSGPAAAGPDPTSEPDDSAPAAGACGCRLPGTPGGGRWAALAVAALSVALRPLRRRRAPRP